MFRGHLVTFSWNISQTLMKCTKPNVKFLNNAEFKHLPEKLTSTKPILTNLQSEQS